MGLYSLGAMHSSHQGCGREMEAKIDYGKPPSVSVSFTYGWYLWSRCSLSLPVTFAVFFLVIHVCQRGLHRLGGGLGAPLAFQF